MKTKLSFLLPLLIAITAPLRASAPVEKVAYDEESGRVLEKGYADMGRFEGRPGVKVVPATDPKVRGIGDRDVSSVIVSSQTGKVELKPASDRQKERAAKQARRDLQEIIALVQKLEAVGKITTTNPILMEAIQAMTSEFESRIAEIQARYTKEQ